MSSFALRFVGQEALPSRLSEFDREQFFELASADVEAITQQFRVSHRLPAALMVLFMRTTGRPLDGFNVLPRTLLRHTAELLGISAPSIATLRSSFGPRHTSVFEILSMAMKSNWPMRFAFTPRRLLTPTSWYDRPASGCTPAGS